MKINLKFLSAAVLTASLLATPITAMAADNTFGAAGATVDTDYTLEEMLTYAIQDEYLAQAEYNAIIEKYGVQRPFSNIVRAEATHISYLLPLFGTYNIVIPENDAAERTVLPATISESYAAGVEAEVINIAMYEEFLKEDLPADVKAIFENLKAASENHLTAFERAASGTTGAGTLGNGNRNSNVTVNGNGTLNGTGNGALNGNGDGNVNGNSKGNGNGRMNGAGRGNGAGTGTGIGNGGTVNCLL